MNNTAKSVANRGAEFPIADISAKVDNVREVNQKYKAKAFTIDRIK